MLFPNWLAKYSNFIKVFYDLEQENIEIIELIDIPIYYYEDSNVWKCFTNEGINGEILSKCKINEIINIFDYLFINNEKEMFLNYLYPIKKYGKNNSLYNYLSNKFSLGYLLTLTSYSLFDCVKDNNEKYVKIILNYPRKKKISLELIKEILNSNLNYYKFNGLCNINFNENIFKLLCLYISNNYLKIGYTNFKLNSLIYNYLYEKKQLEEIKKNDIIYTKINVKYQYDRLINLINWLLDNNFNSYNINCNNYNNLLSKLFEYLINNKNFEIIEKFYKYKIFYKIEKINFDIIEKRIGYKARIFIKNELENINNDSKKFFEYLIIILAQENINYQGIISLLDIYNNNEDELTNNEWLCSNNIPYIIQITNIIMNEIKLDKNEKNEINNLLNNYLFGLEN